MVAAPLLILAVGAARCVVDRSARAVATAAVTVVGLTVAAAANYWLEHFYFRPRPYWVIPSVQALLPRDGDTSFMPWQVIVAAVATTGITLMSRRWGWLSAAAT